MYISTCICIHIYIYIYRFMYIDLQIGSHDLLVHFAAQRTCSAWFWALKTSIYLYTTYSKRIQVLDWYTGGSTRALSTLCCRVGVWFSISSTQNIYIFIYQLSILMSHVFIIHLNWYQGGSTRAFSILCYRAGARRSISSIRGATAWLFCAASMKSLTIGPLQCVAVCCSVLQCVAVCCSALQRVALWLFCAASMTPLTTGVLNCVAVCCGVFQCVALCSVLRQ